jgi:hypothetical protein
MRALLTIGVLLLVLGALSFVIPVSRREHHGLSIGDTRFTLQTESREKLPPAVGIILLGGGALALILGLRKT